MIGIFENLVFFFQFLGPFRNVKRFVVGMLKKFKNDSNGPHVDFLKRDWHAYVSKNGHQRRKYQF